MYPFVLHRRAANVAFGKFRRLFCSFKSHIMGIKLQFMSQQLPNYLRSHRKKTGLSQKEVAYLIGVCTGSRVSRYERFVSHPQLETVLAFEMVFGTQAQFLFGGMYSKVEAEVSERARILSARVKRAKPTGIIALKAATLNRLLTTHGEN
jgi:transcriptional regulator with XRE-family HTH domain